MHVENPTISVQACSRAFLVLFHHSSSWTSLELLGSQIGVDILLQVILCLT
jgi:hypothetical protein